MRVAVLGAGGIGGLYGGLLARAGHEVSFWARGQHLQAIQEHGLQVRSAEFGTFVVHGTASDDAGEFGQGQADLVLLAVKTYDLDAGIGAASQVLDPAGRLITFQNGLDAPDKVASILGEERVLIGTTRLETMIVEPGVIGHLSPGHLVTLAALNGPPTPDVESTALTLRQADINVRVVADGHRALWDKASMLIPMATVTAVCRSSIGPIRDLAETRALADALFKEVAAVALACGYDLGEPRSLEGLSVQSAPPSMKASMARDFERGGHTELEALTGALVSLADARRVQVPVSRTAYAILKLREQLELGADLPVGIGAARR